MTSSDLFPHLSNTFFVADQISGASDRDLVNDPEAPEIYVDPYFGHAWSWTPKPGAALYGRTEDFPASPIEAHGSGAYVRAPFRRIPIIDVHSPRELLQIAASTRSEDPSVRGIWRGQANQFYLKRSDTDKLRLYGETDVKEPSLLPSASRTTAHFPDLFDGWSGLLDLYMKTRADHLSAGYTSQAARLDTETQNFRCGYNYRLWGLATAQHYGLPSVGLDVTPDIEVALFFALHRFIIDSATGGLTVNRVDASAEPIVYGLGGFENDLLDDKALSPAWLQCPRPKAQKAMFFSTAWGTASNKAAERIYVVLRIVDHMTWCSRLSVQVMFPNGPDDPFVEFLLAMRGRFSDPLLSDLLRRIYFAP